jgi:putative membrane protein
VTDSWQPQSLPSHVAAPSTGLPTSGEPTVERPPATAAVPPAPAAGSAVDDLPWRRFHPVTPVIKGWKVLLILIVILAQQTADNVGAAQDVVRDLGWGPVFGLLGVVLLIAMGYAAVAWRMTRYAIGADAVYLRSGVLFRRQRTARLDRIQAIDVVQPLVARIIGLAELKIEVAGGADSAIKLSFLREQAAQDLRNELLARAAGVVVAPVASAGGDGGAAAVAAIPVAPEREVFAVTAQRLLGSLVRSIGVLVSVLLVVALVVAVVWTGEIGPAFGLLPALLGAAGFVWQRFAGEFNFRAALSPARPGAGGPDHPGAALARQGLVAGRDERRRLRRHPEPADRGGSAAGR